MSDDPPPKGWLAHYSNKKPVHPDGGSSNPGNNTTLVLYSGGFGESRLQVQFEPVEGEGHFGYIRHVSSGKYVHPKGGDISPGDNTSLVYYSGKHSACLFCFDEANNLIIHQGSNKIWHPKGGDSNPGNNTACVLHSDRHGAAKFFMADSKGNKISPYPPYTLSGKWVVLQSTLDPQSDQSFTIEVTNGEERTETSTVNNAWNVSAEVAKGLFSASAEYSGFVEHTNSQTWSSSVTTTRTINVKAGKSVVTWQWDFGLGQYGDAYTYYSNIVADTDSLDTQPPPPTI